MSEPLEESYFNWLCAKVMHVEVPTPSLTYYDLLRSLHQIEFVWLVLGDDNRFEDGLELRREFLIASRLEPDPEWEHTPCSVFEMLVAFSRRAAFATDMPNEHWFWIFLDNLGLGDMNDASYFDPEELEERVDQLIWRTYRYDGLGGMFPLRSPKHDQREVQIWYQFCEYLVDQELA